MEKYKRNEVSPVEKENERDQNYKASNPQIDNSRTKYNYHIIAPQGKYLDMINKRLTTLPLSRKLRSDAIYMNSFVVGSDKQFFDRLSLQEQYAFFNQCVQFFARKYGQENILSAVIHEDESTPHMHLNIVPIVNQKLCSKDLFDKTKLSILQTELYQDVGRKFGLMRGKEGSQAKHLSTAEYKAKKILQQAEDIREQTKQYAQALEETERGEISKNKHKLREQVVATVTENKQLKQRLNTSVNETLQLAEQNKTLQQKYEKREKAVRIATALQKENPKEFERIVSGRKLQSGMAGFFQSVLQLFTPEITAHSNRLREIEKEIQQAQQEYNKQQNTNYWRK